MSVMITLELIIGNKSKIKLHQQFFFGTQYSMAGFQLFGFLSGTEWCLVTFADSWSYIELMLSIQLQFFSKGNLIQ